MRVARSEPGIHPPYWCDECARPHVGSLDDLRAILGDRGTLHGVAYCWDRNRKAYNLSSPKSALERQRAALARLHHVTNPAHVRRVPKPKRGEIKKSHARKGIRVLKESPKRFANRYEAKRTHLDAMTRGGGPGIKVETHPVDLTDATRRALEAANAWSTDVRKAERRRDLRALDRRLRARDRKVA